MRQDELFGMATYEKVILGMQEGGIENVDHYMEKFENSDALQRAARKWARERLEKESGPLAFSVVERATVHIRACADHAALLRAAGQDPSHWEYSGVWTPTCTHDAFMVVGCFNHSMSLDDALGWAASQSEHGKLVGAGAIGRQAWHNARPEYAGEKERHFPGTCSRWKHKFGLPGDCGPSMWHDGGRMGAFGMNWYGAKMSPGHLFHFLVAQ